ncbi:MAG: helicase [Chitinophagaceae bacterium]|nr:helicase [Chitinophagaceae bacterium]
MNEYMQNQRLIFKDTIRKGLIGPGSDIFGVGDEQEIISDYPLKRYYSAVLFPEKETSRVKQATIGLEDYLDAQSEISDDEEEGNEIVAFNENAETKPTIPEGKKNTNRDLTEELYSEANHYFPNNFGLTFCVDNSAKTVIAEFSFAMYEQVKKGQGKIAISKEDFDLLTNNHIFNLSEYLHWEDGFMFFVNGKPLPFDSYTVKSFFSGEEAAGLRDSIGYYKMALLLGRMWKRKAFSPPPLTINLSESDSNEFEGITIFQDEETQNAVTCYYKRVYQTPYGKYVKILMANRATHPKAKYSNTNEQLNQKCLFQVQVKVSGAAFKPYKPLTEVNPFDEELNIINFQYKDELSFAIGHGCSVNWNNSAQPTELSTTFQPEVDIKNYSNDFRAGFPEDLKEITLLKNLSIWTSLDREELIQKLKLFAQEYKNWIVEQNKTTVQPNEISIKDKLVANHNYTHERLIKNIDFLDQDATAYKAFLLANTAMYLQMILSRDEDFGNKPKDLADFPDKANVKYDDIEYFKTYDKIKLAYRPFQLAFFILNIESSINKDSEDRNGIVDLIWFPTGGGKTEAYLALTAFTIISRRLLYGANSDGVSVIMRYTLRLLTAQQFDRANKLILSLEFLRKKFESDSAYSIGNNPISVGLWVGAATTPNNYSDAWSQYKDLQNTISNANQGKQTDVFRRNKFPITSCPYCGCNLVSRNTTTNYLVSGYKASEREFTLKCLNNLCTFKGGLPIHFIDEKIYDTKPTLLFATVDKFAMLSHRPEGHKLFNSLDSNLQPPDLIIQDELHLLSGPLGSITGLYETIIEMLCTKGNQKPKIIASTATTRNTREQVKMLYGNRRLNVFPAPGISYKDNFFSFITEESKRKHIGFFPTGKTSVDSQIQLLAHLLLARIFLFRLLKLNSSEEEAIEKIDHYWTIVSFYNSLKDVGKIYNKVPAEIISLLKMLHFRFKDSLPAYSFNFQNLPSRTRELTSRVPSNSIKSLLNEMEHQFSLRKTANNNTFVADTVDLVLASNMFSVGIDIKRLNVMLMNGQPRNIAEYIQASSRVGRDSQGIVINLLDANRSREKSYFENYKTFHNSYYKYVEPLSVTPFTEIALDKVLNTILVCYVRHKKGLSEDAKAKDFDGQYDELKQFLSHRITEPGPLQYALDKLEKLSAEWLAKKEDLDLQYKNHDTQNHNLIQKTSVANEWSLMQSMREIDTNSIIKIMNDEL